MREGDLGEHGGNICGTENSLSSENGHPSVRMADLTSDVPFSDKSKWLGYKNFTESFSPPQLLSS